VKAVADGGLGDLGDQRLRVAQQQELTRTAPLEGDCLANDTVGEFLKQRIYAFRSTEFKALTQLKLNSPTVSFAKQSPSAGIG
jgi:hypothetical protein